MLVIGFIGSLTPLIASLSPNESILDSKPTINIDGLESVGIIDAFIYPYHVFVVKLNDPTNPYSVFAIPYKEGKYYLPEFGWNRPNLPCSNFDQGLYFQCIDTYKDKSDIVWWGHMKWGKNGKYIGEQKHLQYGYNIPNLYEPEYTVVGNHVYLLSIPKS